MATAEDPMELSSEMNPLANAEDIDIDLITSDLPQEGEDDFMAEDITTATDQELPDIEPPPVGNDDEMFDDEYPSGEFQRNSSVHDEDLEDAEEPTVGYNETTTSATLEDNIENQPMPQEDAVDFAHANAKTHESNLQDLENIQEPTSLSGLAEEHSLSNFDPQVTSLHDKNMPGELGDMPIAPDRSNGNAGSRYDDQPEGLTGIPNAQEDEGGPSEPPSVIHDVNTNKSELLATNTDFSHTISYVHPIVVVYQDNEMSLFPPVEQEQEQSQTYFLQDEAYAAGSINNLLRACRSVLGDSINEQNELEIQIEELGLHVSEFAPESYTTTLAEILDVYVQLQRHDGIDSPGPLYIVLCTKIRFSHRMKYLVNAVAEGKGFSQLPLLESPDEDDPQSEYSEKQDNMGKDDLQNTDVTTYTEAEDSQPVNIETGDVNKGDDSVEVDRNIARSTPNELGAHARNTEAPDISSPDGSTPVEDEAKLTQLSSTKEDVSVSNELGPNREQNLTSKVEGDISVPSSVGVIRDTLVRPEDTAVEDEENLINYEDEDGEADVNHEFSTRSSTIQGDSIEASKVDSQQKLTRQALIPSNASRVLEEEETEVAAYTENLEIDNGEILDFGQEGEDLEQDHSQGDEHSHEQDDSPSPDQEDEPDVHKEGVYDENLSAKQGQTEFGPTHTLTEDYEDPDSQDIFLEDSEPWSQNRGDAPVALEDGDNSHEDNFDFTLDHTESGENQETAKVNETLSNGDAYNSNFSNSVSTHHTIADQEAHEKPNSNFDEINYEEDEDVDLSKLPAEHSGNASPGSLKRMRSDEANGLLEDDLQDLKRVRSR